MQPNRIDWQGMAREAMLSSAMLMVIVLFACMALAADSNRPQTHGPHFKILHIMSYHAPWKWTDDQFTGFKSVLKDMDVEYRVFQMDTKRKTSEERKQRIGMEARAFIDIWQPDLVYTSDDDAQEYVARYYVNHKIPFVFSGVNADPANYGFTGCQNVTGVLEQEHFIATVQLLKQIVPHVKKVAVIFDDDHTWKGVRQRIEHQLCELPDISISSWDTLKTFRQYRQRIKALQTETDAIALLGNFTFKDDQGNNVPYTEVLKWTAENSRLPDFSLWADRIPNGTLCAVTVSGYQQGQAAGRLARGILRQGRSPGSYAMQPTLKGERVVSLARARKLHIRIRTGVLLTAGIIKKFDWE